MSGTESTSAEIKKLSQTQMLTEIMGAREYFGQISTPSYSVQQKAPRKPQHKPPKPKYEWPKSYPAPAKGPGSLEDIQAAAATLQRACKRVRRVRAAAATERRMIGAVIGADRFAQVQAERAGLLISYDAVTFQHDNKSMRGKTNIFTISFLDLLLQVPQQQDPYGTARQVTIRNRDGGIVTSSVLRLINDELFLAGTIDKPNHFDLGKDFRSVTEQPDRLEEAHDTFRKIIETAITAQPTHTAEQIEEVAG